MKAYFGSDMPLTQITSARISSWKGEQLVRTLSCKPCRHRDPHTGEVVHFASCS